MFVPWETTRRGGGISPASWALPDVTHPPFYCEKKQADNIQGACQQLRSTQTSCNHIVAALSHFNTSELLHFYFSQIWRYFHLIYMFSSADCLKAFLLVTSIFFKLFEKTQRVGQRWWGQRSISLTEGALLIEFFPEGHVWGQQFCFLQHTWGFRSLFISIT